MGKSCSRTTILSRTIIVACFQGWICTVMRLFQRGTDGYGRGLFARVSVKQEFLEPGPGEVRTFVLGDIEILARSHWRIIQRDQKP